ncbi:hypothetical protein F5883DRAFT_647663 [Diaporthe sp. PMI_573]|nr:hypothetical protein F5883DRAFT_647663 [Diaporthaceae sp. PMI_573]
MAQFHSFTDLPKELRDQIWDMAIRDDDPAVHLFTIYDAEKDHDSVVNPAKKVHATRASYDPSFYVGFAAPRCRASGQLSWTDGNISTYLTDSGLWTACHESRDRMLRRFRPSETSPQASPQHMPLDRGSVWEIRDKPTASINMEFIRDNGEHQCLTIQPSADLILLQLPENSNISWDSSNHWYWIEDFPSFRWHTNERYWISSRIKNVAVEYDPAWAIFDPRKEYGPFRGVTGGFSEVDEICGLENFWFIDYSLKRKYKSDNCERQTFRAGRLTFIEVNSMDYEWCRCPKEGSHCLEFCEQGPGRDMKYSAHALVERVKDFNESVLDDVHSIADMRVLACVDLELEGELPTMEEWYEMNAYW